VNIFIAQRSGKRIGPVDPETIYKMLDDGTIATDDLAWVTPMRDWRPLYQILPDEEYLYFFPGGPPREPGRFLPSRRLNRPAKAGAASATPVVPAATGASTPPAAPVEKSGHRSKAGAVSATPVVHAATGTSAPPVAPVKKTGLRPIPPMGLRPHWWNLPLPEEPPLFPEEEPPPPSTKRTLALVITVITVFAVLITAALYNILGNRARAIALKKTPTLYQSPLGKPLLPQQAAAEIKQRDRVIAQLQGRLAILPSKPSAVSLVFYHDFRLIVSKGPSPMVPWSVALRGIEERVAPNTQHPVSRTTFTLVTDYQQGEWTFKRYDGSVENLNDGTKSEIKAGENRGLPPRIVYDLRLKL